MSASIDQRVVEMRFDNQQFDKGVQSTLSWLDRLKQCLKLDGAAKGLDSIQKRANGINLSALQNSVETISGRFTNLGIIGVTALQNITNAAIRTGTQMVKSLTIEPVMTGFDEYETKMNAITTILTNTQSKGTTLDDVNKALDELNTYADQTIYNFGEMTRNIGTFTAAGVDLDTSVKAIKGIANLAAGSGSTSAQASSAMYQLSQALAAGRVSLQDWNSVVNAGMGGEMFQNALKETAKQMGIVVDESVSFRDSLSTAGGQESWLTSDVLVKTLEKFADDETLVKAATQVKTVSQLFSTMGESVQSGWAQSWEYIIGNRDQATETLTAVSDAFNNLIQPSTDARNAMLKFWNENGGRDAIIDAIGNSFQFLTDVLEPIGNAFNKAFPPMTGERLVEISNKIKDLTENFKLSDATAKNIERTFSGVFAVFRIGGKVLGTLAKAFGDFIGFLAPTGGSLLNFTASIGDFLVGLDNSIDKTDTFGKALETVERFLAPFAKGLQSIGTEVSEFVSSLALAVGSAGLKNFGKVVEGRLSPLIAFANVFEAAASTIISWFKKVSPILASIATVFSDALGDMGDGIADSISSFNFDNVFDIINSGLFAGILLGIKNFMSSASDILDDGGDIFGNLSKILDGVRGSLKAYQTSIKAKSLLTIAGAIAVLAGSLVTISLIDSEKLTFSLTAIGVMMAELATVMTILNKTMSAGKFDIFNSTTRGMITLAAGVLVLSFAVSRMANLEWENLKQGLVAVGAMMTELAVFMKATDLNRLGILKATGITILAASLNVFASAVSKFAYMDTDSLKQGLAAMGGVLLEVAAFTKMTTNTSGVIRTATGLTILAASMEIFADVIFKMGILSPEVLAKGLGSLAAALVSISVALKLVPKGSLLKATSIAGVAASLLILSQVMNQLSGLSWEEIGRGLISLAGGLTVIAVALRAMKSTIAGAAAMLVMTTALLGLVPVLKILGGMSFAEIGASLLALAGVFTVFGVAGFALGGLVPVILALSAAIAVFGVGVAAVGAGVLLLATGLTGLAASGVAAAAGLAAILGTIVGIIPAVIKQIGVGIVEFANVITQGAPAIGQAFVALVVSAAQALGESIPEVLSNVTKILDAVIEFVLENAPKLGDAFVDLFVAALNLVADRMPDIVVAVMNVISSLMNSIGMVVGQVSTADLANLLLAITGMVAIFSIMAAASTVAKQALIGAGSMMLVMAGITLIFTALAAIPIDTSMGLAQSLSQLLLALSASMALISFIPITGALTGIAGMAVVVAGITGIIVALGAIKQIPGFTWLMGEGTKVIGMIGNAIGQFAGGIIGGFAEGVSNSFPKIGQNLADFMTNAEPFFSGLDNINADSLTGVKALAEAILVLTAADVLNGLTSWFTGGSSLTDFAEDLKEFGPAFAEYAASVEGIDGASVEASATAAKAMAEFASSIPNSGGLLAKITGENDIVQFAEQMKAFGPSLMAYANSVSGLDPEVVTNSATAAQALAELATNLPNTGGLVAFFTGDNGLSTFAEQLAPFGKAMGEYANSVSGLSAEAVTNSANAAKALAELANNLPNTGGLAAFFAGDNDLGTFGNQLSSFGHALKAYADSVSGIDYTAISLSLSNVERLTQIANSMSGVDFWVFAELDSALSQIGGTGVQNFINAFTANIGSATAAATNLASQTIAALRSVINTNMPTITADARKLATNLIMGMVSTLNSKRITVVTTFKALLTMMITQGLSYLNSTSVRFSQVAMTLMQAFANGIRVNGTTVVLSVQGVANQAANSVSGYYSRFYAAGAQMMNGLANGIRNNRAGAINAASSAASAALQAAQRTLQIHSPSRRFEWLGEMSDKGLANGFLKFVSYITAAGRTVGNTAYSMLSDAMNRSMDFLNSGIDYAPTIRPVLDLSAVASGISTLDQTIQNGNFGLTAGFHGLNSQLMMNNLAAISQNRSTMMENRTPRDLTNRDVVNAIQTMGDQILTLREAIANMKVVTETGALVGQIETKIDQRLGIWSARKGRGV